MPRLVQGLERLAEYDYVAIFDADFKPDADFLVSDRIVACTANLANNCTVLVLQLFAKCCFGNNRVDSRLQADCLLPLPHSSACSCCCRC